jgi:hypothetical protein
MDHNGGSVIAMVGKECVAIASDLRLGNQALGISSNFQRVCAFKLCHYHRILMVFADIPSNGSNLPWTSGACNRCCDTVSRGPPSSLQILLK